MFSTDISLDTLNAFSKNTLVEHLGIELTELTATELKGKMPVDHRTHQPFGLLHGGASVVLAESLGSVASNMLLPPDGKLAAVGLEINANHVRSVRSGWVYGTVSAIHIGRKTHVWDIKIVNEEGKLVCISRLTVAIVEVS